MLNVTFGVDLDGYHPLENSPLCGEITLGPLGLLGLLETRLALNSPSTNEACRIVQYRACLKDADDGRRFYSDSFTADPQTTASTLLQWRDTWVAAGWQGTCAATDAATLRDLAAVEALATGRLAPGVGDRLRTVLATLRGNPLSDLTIRLIEDPVALPWLWREILALLGATIDSPSFLSTPQAPPDTDLHRLQEALCLRQATTLQGDGTVVLLTAHNETLLARAVSQIVHHKLEATANPWFGPLATTLLQGGQAGILDTVFAGDDGPRTGQSELSCWRPPLQVLPLALSLLWEPLDPYRLLEFLTHPVGPLPRGVRSRLAPVVAAQPGVGGEAWRAAVDELIAEASARKDHDPAAGELLRRRIDFWLAPQRHDPATGAPLTLLAERCAEIARWAGAAAEHTATSPAEQSLLYAASAQAGQACDALDLLRRSGEQRLNRLQLERILDQVTAAGAPLGSQRAELGHIPVRSSPGAVIEPVERLIWWQFTEPTLPSRSPWSGVERAQLTAAGINLPSNQQLLAGLSGQWLLPVLAAKQQIILAVPRTLRGEATRHHPLRDLIETLVGKSLPHIEIGEALAHQPGAGQLRLTGDQVPARDLPAPKRWWELPRPELLGPREKPESYSSLEKFIGSPYQWVLNYKAGLYPARIERIDPVTQRGNLLHHLIERLFAGGCDWRQANQDIVQTWGRAACEQLLREEGANWLLPGRIKERQDLIQIAGMTVWQLVRALRAAKVCTAVTEQEVTGSFTGGELTGFIDLLVTNEHGDEAVIDLKWGGTSYRKDLLKENQALQLALYAYLRQKQGRWPAQAFFILQEGRLLAQDQRFFPTAEICAPVNPNSCAQSLWVDFEKTWRWRREQLNKGWIEVTVVGTQADGNSVSPGLIIAECNDRFNDFDALTGWPEGA